MSRIYIQSLERNESGSDSENFFGQNNRPRENPLRLEKSPEEIKTNKEELEFDEDINDEEDVLLDAQVNNPPITHRFNTKVSYSQLNALYKEYNRRSLLILRNPHTYKLGISVRSIGQKLRMAKSSVHFYFDKFKRNPYYMVGKTHQYLSKLLINMRKSKPKHYNIEKEYEVVEYILRNRQHGFLISNDEIKEKAKVIINCSKTKFTDKWVSKFKSRHNLTKRKPTTIMELGSNSVIKIKFENFYHIINIFRERFNYDPECVLNMDETSVFFDFAIDSVDVKGTKFVARARLGNEKKRVTCVLTSTSNGTLLRPMVIDNSNEILTLDENDFITKPIFAKTKNAWIDRDLMVIWLHKIILPHIKRKRTLLVLDCCRAHISKRFEEEIIKYDFIDIVFIPGGLTSILQPNDLVLNRIFKSKFRKFWHERLLDLKTRYLQSLNQVNEMTEVIYSNKPPLVQISDIKNNTLREQYKAGIFKQGRAKKKKVQTDIQVPQVSLLNVLYFVDRSLMEISNEKRGLIQKSFRIAGISPLLPGERLHDFNYEQSRHIRVIVNRRNIVNE